MADDASVGERGCDDCIVGDDNDGGNYNEDEACAENDEDDYDAGPLRPVKWKKGGSRHRVDCSLNRFIRDPHFI